MFTVFWLKYKHFVFLNKIDFFVFKRSDAEIFSDAGTEGPEDG